MDDSSQLSLAKGIGRVAGACLGKRSWCRILGVVVVLAVLSREHTVDESEGALYIVRSETLRDKASSGVDDVLGSRRGCEDAGDGCIGLLGVRWSSRSLERLHYVEDIAVGVIAVRLAFEDVVDGVDDISQDTTEAPKKPTALDIVEILDGRWRGNRCREQATRKGRDFYNFMHLGTSKEG